MWLRKSMNYKEFGNTNEKISALGFGCMRFPEYEKDGKSEKIRHSIY